MYTLFLIIAIAFVQTVCAKCSDCQNSIVFGVPEPKIDIFSKGFRVAIPDRDGMSLFAFHGNINRPMNNLEAGQYSKDVVRKEGNQWVFEDTKTKLEVGDVIYYWLFVVKSKLGYRYDNGKFVVKEILPYKSLEIDSNITSHVDQHLETTTHFEPVDSPALNSHTKDHEILKVPTEHQPISICCQLFLNLSTLVTSLSTDLERLTEENKILADLAQKDDYYARTIKIFAKNPTDYYPRPKDFVQNLISEKLGIRSVKIMEAKVIPDNGISFKVEKLSDKVKIVVAAEQKLKGSNYELSW